MKSAALFSLTLAAMGTGLVGAAAAPMSSDKPAIVIHIKNFAFDPTSATITAGQSVEWINDDSVDHSATATDKSWDSGELDQGKSWTHTFDKPGSYTYYCDDHDFMKAKLIVK